MTRNIVNRRLKCLLGGMENCKALVKIILGFLHTHGSFEVSLLTYPAFK